MPDSSPLPPPSSPVVVDLGCGFRKKPGAIGLDIARLPQVDVLADVTRTLPFRDSSVDEVVASHLIEHVDNVMELMAEIWRICKPGALVYFRFPHASTPFVTWVDPTHRRGVLLATFDYFDPDTLNGYLFNYYQRTRFRIVRKKLSFNLNAGAGVAGRTRRVAGRIFDALANRGPRAQYLCERFWGPIVGIEEAHIWLRAIK
jgi:SAM-dependent methyltransferase